MNDAECLRYLYGRLKDDADIVNEVKLELEGAYVWFRTHTGAEFVVTAEDNHRYALSQEPEPGWGLCGYCGETVQLPATYCSLEHAEGRRME